MVVRTIGLVAAAGALLGLGACASGTTVPTAAATSPASLSPAWLVKGGAVEPTVDAAQVAPGAYRPVPTSTGVYLAVSPAATVSPAVTVPASAGVVCAPMLGPATSIPVTATAGTGTVTAHFNDLSDPSVLLYRVAAIPDSGSPTAWLTVAATHTCTTLSTTITGLTKGKHYQVWVDAVHTVTTYGISRVTQETMIGRSLTVTVL